MVTTDPGTPEGLPSWLVPGARLAGYRIEELLGAGGMAVVYRAYHEGMGREVALKVFAPALSDDQAFRRRFMREAHLVAKVEHPNIIPVYEAAQERGVSFIAMRLARGGDLRAVLTREGAMSAGRAAGFLSPFASALDAAHEAGLVHRNVTPANILVDEGRGRPEHVYLTDFGLASGVATGEPAVVSLSTSGQFTGTPGYAAPEQITGGDVGGLADQYALGCVAFTLLTGSAPFPREQPIAVMYAQLHDPPPLVTRTRRDLPGAVNEVVARAMAREPNARFRSCTAFADALREALGLPPWGTAGTRTYPRDTRASQAAAAPERLLGYSLARPAQPASPPQPASPDETSGHAPDLGAWIAEVAADRAYYNTVWGADVPAEEVIPFPDNAVERRFPLSGPELLIGRRSASRGISPEIDITSSPDGPPTDTGVSREHAKLVAGPDGSWSVVDLGTANGTLVNGEEIPPGTPIRLRDGDRVNLGMWTVISINRDAATARGTPSPSGTGRAPGYLRARGQSQRGGEQALLRAAPAH